MGFFKSVFKGISKIQPFKQPVRAIAAVSTLGQSEVFRALPKPIQAAAVQAAGTVASIVTVNPTPLALANAFTASQPQGGQPMAFNVGQFLGGVSSAFGGSSNPFLANTGAVANIASSFFQPSSGGFSPAMATPPVVFTGGSTAVAVRPGVSGGLTKEVFDAGAKVLARLGIPFRASPGAFSRTLKTALGSIVSLARRTPAGSVIGLLAGIGLSQLESNLLVAWHAQRRRHRRMNPANAKALRRAGRRIKSFHKLCGSMDLIKPRRTAVGGKCTKCRKRSCSC
jgi:hypothetical protein